MKRTMIAGGVVVLLLSLVLGRSYVKTAWHEVKDTVKNSVSIDFELKRARQMIKDLQPEIERNLRLIAQEEVEVAKLERRSSSAEEQLAKERTNILRLKGDLESGSEAFVYAGRSYTAKEVKADLSARFEQFKTQEATAVALGKILAARQQGLEAAREKLDKMLDARRQLEVDVENLEARLTMVEVAQASSEFRFDESQLSRTQQLVDDISTRIEVAERLVQVDSGTADRIPLDAEETERDIMKEVANYFETSLPEVEAYVRKNP